MNKHHRYLVIIFLVLITIISFGHILNNDFINFDDNLYITENHQIKSGINVQTIKWAFTAVVASNWHPLTLLSHTLDWSLFGTWAGGHHLVSLLFHIGAVLFLFLFLSKTTKQLWPSAIVAALFAVHPLRVESVAWASERKDVLSMFFGMATLYAYAFYVEDKKISRYLLCFLLFVLALMSKPMMVTLPFVLLLIDYWPLQRWQKVPSPEPHKTQVVAQQQKNKKKKKRKSAEIHAEHAKKPIIVQNTKQLTIQLIKEKIPLFALSVISSLVTVWAQDKGRSIASLDILPFSDRLANALVSYAVYLGKTFWPVNLSIFYPHQLLSGWQILGAILLLAITTTGVLFFVRKAPFLITGWLWYLGTLVPVIGLVQVGNQAMADRYTYLPSVGILIMLVWGLLYLVPKEKKRKSVLTPLSVVAILVMMLLSWQYCRSWKNSVAIFSHALKTTRNNHLAHNNLGVAFDEAGKRQEAIYHYRAALEIHPEYDSALVNLGAALAAVGKSDEAVVFYRQAIRKNPMSAHAHINLGVALAAAGNKQEAIRHYYEAIKIDPNLAEAHYNLGNLFAAERKNSEAESCYRQAVRTNPGHSKAYYNLAEVLLKSGKINEAIEHFEKSVELDPLSFKALNNLGVLLEKQARHDEAISYYQKAMQLEPENAGLHFNLGVALGNKGDLEKAVKHFEKALEINPKLTQARQALNMAKEMQKQN